VPGHSDLRVGDRVWFRHAKSGEVMERFATVHLVRGEAVEASVPTYRGEGGTFG
jgi:D-serine deaminase-like pyridoxal phosphate-dependent protein